MIERASAQGFHGMLIGFVDSLEHAVFQSSGDSAGHPFLHCLGVRAMQLNGLALSVARETHRDDEVELVSADASQRMSCSFVAKKNVGFQPVYVLRSPTTLSTEELLQTLTGTCSIISFCAGSNQQLILRACSSERDVFAWFGGVASLAFSSSGLSLETVQFSQRGSADRMRLIGRDDWIDFSFTACGSASSLALLGEDGREIAQLHTAGSL
jgi:hypothetical protein